MKKKRILYVEDNMANRLLVQQILESVGYEVLEAVDGLNGINVAREQRPDLILMDIMLPGVDGGALIERLRKEPETSDLPIIAMSASRTLRDRTAELQADALLSKPFDVDALLVQVSFLLNREKPESDQ